jgi:hypothetical protein
MSKEQAQQVVTNSGYSGNNQFVHQVIYNQGSIVINNPSNSPAFAAHTYLGH